MSPPIFDTVRNLLQINACLLQYSRRFVSSCNPHQTRCEQKSFCNIHIYQLTHFMCHGTLVSHYVRQYGTQWQHSPQYLVLRGYLARKLLLHLASYLVGRFCVVWHASWILTLPVARLVGIANCLSGHGGLENWFSMRKREHFHLCLSAIRLLISTGGYPIGFIRLMRFTA